jgi:zinc/manganese transport system permease protein
LLTLRRMSLFGDALSHAVLPGVALGFMFFGLSLTALSAGGFLAGVIVVAVAGIISRHT